MSSQLRIVSFDANETPFNSINEYMKVFSPYATSFLTAESSKQQSDIAKDLKKLLGNLGTECRGDRLSAITLKVDDFVATAAAEHGDSLTIDKLEASLSQSDALVDQLRSTVASWINDMLSLKSHQRLQTDDPAAMFAIVADNSAQQEIDFFSQITQRITEVNKSFGTPMPLATRHPPPVCASAIFRKILSPAGARHQTPPASVHRHHKHCTRAWTASGLQETEEGAATLTGSSASQPARISRPPRRCSRSGAEGRCSASLTSLARSASPCRA